MNAYSMTELDLTLEEFSAGARNPAHHRLGHLTAVRPLAKKSTDCMSEKPASLAPG